MSPPVSGSGTPGSSTGHSMTASLSHVEHGRRASGSIPRAESPPLVTANAHPDMEDYQRSFWERQMAKVEEQMMLPAHDIEEGTATATGMDANASGDASALAAMIPPGTTAKELMEIFKPQAGQLPLARIKKVMKASDDDVKMISAEAPILFARACEIFIADLTCRSYLHATSHRRRTVQRSDVVAAVAGSNVFDFLVDIVPRGGEGAAATSSNHGEAMQQGEEGQESFDGAAYPVQNGENGATE